MQRVINQSADGVLLTIQHTEPREWLPNATCLPSVINLSCCYWLPRDSPHDSRRVTSAGTTRGLSSRPWRHCGGVLSVQVHSLGLNIMWISHCFRCAAARSTETTASLSRLQRRRSCQSNCQCSFKYMNLTKFQTVLSSELSFLPALNSPEQPPIFSDEPRTGRTSTPFWFSAFSWKLLVGTVLSASAADCADSRFNRFLTSGNI